MRFGTIFLTAACALMSQNGAGAVTFYGDVLEILQENCQACHRPGGANLGGMVAPMAFVTYEETRPWAKAIQKQVSNRTMPPWHASEAFAGVFENERTLMQSEIDIIVAWVAQGTPAGDVADAPPAREWPSNDGWSIGEPDLIVSMPEPYFVTDDVEDIYRTFTSEVTSAMLPEPRYMKAIEFRPGSSVVHHIIAEPLGGIAPGNDPTIYPDGVGRMLRPGTSIRWQMHYHKEPGAGSGVYDQSQAGIRFYASNDEVKHRVSGEPFGRFDFLIPAGAPAYSTQQELTVPSDVQIVSMMPHMHLRGKAAKYEAFYPDGSQEVLLEVPRYDFNWQTSYRYREFKEIPAGTKIVFTSTWDNSAQNPNNPDPTRPVHFGQPTTDEMSFGFMTYIDSSGETRQMTGRRGGGREIDLSRIISTFDANGDGSLQRDESPERFQRFFDRIDLDGDGSVTVTEAETAQRFVEMRRNRAAESQ